MCSIALLVTFPRMQSIIALVGFPELAMEKILPKLTFQLIPGEIVMDTFKFIRRI